MEEELEKLVVEYIEHSIYLINYKEKYRLKINKHKSTGNNLLMLSSQVIFENIDLDENMIVNFLNELSILLKNQILNLIMCQSIYLGLSVLKSQ